MAEQFSPASVKLDDDAPQLTVVGLFEDSIDADLVFSDLRKDTMAPEGVSLIVREHESDISEVVHDAAGIATAIRSTGLVHAGDWLSHLVSLIVPELGVVLAAGPIGAVLAASDRHDVDLSPEPTSDTSSTHEHGPIPLALVRFGYGDDEASYIASRIEAGSVFIGVTTADSECAVNARRTFADRSAVHIGTNWTAPGIASHAEFLVRTPVESAHPEDVVVLDSVGVLVSLCTREETHPETGYRGAPVIDNEGNQAGVIEDLLAEVSPGPAEDTETIQIRYVVLGFGGVLGIRRGRVAVPAEYVKLDVDPIRTSLNRESLRHAPSFHSDRPFSRHEEELVCSYFGCSAYWTRS